MFETVIDVLIDALLDTLKIMPFLLITHILIELYEYRAGSKIKVNKLLGGKYSPFLGTAVGLVPQCGFSVVATRLYTKKNIRLGTLMAVYIATSDEAIPILLTSGSSALKLLPLLGIKTVFAIIMGFSINLFLKDKEVLALQAVNEPEHSKGCHGHTIGEHTHEHNEKKRFDYDRFVFHPLVHTLTICGFILIVNILIGAIIEWVGHDTLEGFMQGARLVQPFVAGLVGLIPNCAGSVVIAQMYAVGALNLGAAVAGLSVNAGIALAVLFKENKNLKQNILIILLLYVASAILGFIIAMLF